MFVRTYIYFFSFFVSRPFFLSSIPSAFSRTDSFTPCDSHLARDLIIIYKQLFTSIKTNWKHRIRQEGYIFFPFFLQRRRARAPIQICFTLQLSASLEFRPIEKKGAFFGLFLSRGMEINVMLGRENFMKIASRILFFFFFVNTIVLLFSSQSTGQKLFQWIILHSNFTRICYLNIEENIFEYDFDCSFKFSSVCLALRRFVCWISIGKLSERFFKIAFQSVRMGLQDPVSAWGIMESK